MSTMNKMDMAEVHRAVTDLNKEKLIELLHRDSEPVDLSKEADLFLLLTETVIGQPDHSKAATQIVYLLSIYGADINSLSQEAIGQLLVYMKTCGEASSDFIQALLRCGLDVTGKVQDGESLLNHILHSDVITRHVKELVLSYLLGMWKAVECDDAMAVRRLVNQWCNIRVTKKGKSLLQLAFEKGTEDIIRVITGIGASMDLAHSVLAGNLEYVKSLLKSNRKLNVNIKNLTDRGATPLFYAVSDNNYDMVTLLLESGARLDIGMQGENDMELPLYFAALSNGGVENALLRNIIPVSPVPVDQLFYRGCNVLFYCIEHNVSGDLFEDILRSCSAYVLTHKIERNISARDYAVSLDRNDIVTRIDKVVSEWIYYSPNKKNRNILALHGYRHVPALQDMNCNEKNLDDCFLHLTDYENHKLLLTQAVEDGDLPSVKEMLYYESVLGKGLETCLVDCRCSFSGQPLLHKAVLHGHAEITQLLADTLIHITKQKIDSIRDQYFRTCLHYAYGMENGKQLINILEEHGASEFAMDKDGRSPLAFKDRQGQKEMKDLLQYHLAQDFCKPEPDPWSVPLPLPIMGYISKCLHNHHHKKQAGTKPLSCDQYDKIDLKTSQMSSDGDDFCRQYSQIKQNNNLERTKPYIKHVRISESSNELELTTSPSYDDLDTEQNYGEPFQQEVTSNQTGASKVQPKNGISIGKMAESDYLSSKDSVVQQRESLEHSDSWKTSSVDTESEGSEEYEADNSSSEEEQVQEEVQTLEQKFCPIL